MTEKEITLEELNDVILEIERENDVVCGCNVRVGRYKVNCGFCGKDLGQGNISHISCNPIRKFLWELFR